MVVLAAKGKREKKTGKDEASNSQAATLEYVARL